MVVGLMRLILVCLLSTTTMLSLASAYPATAGARVTGDVQASDDNAAGGCCKKDKDAHDDGCSGHCMMQCCRAMPMTPRAAPTLDEYGPVIEAAVLVPIALHSLADPEAIFHPPRV